MRGVAGLVRGVVGLVRGVVGLVRGVAGAWRRWAASLVGAILVDDGAFGVLHQVSAKVGWLHPIARLRDKRNEKG